MWGPDEHRSWCMPCPDGSFSSGSTSDCTCAGGKYMRILVRCVHLHVVVTEGEQKGCEFALLRAS